MSERTIWSQYHKIQSVFKRDPETKFKTFIAGAFSEQSFDDHAENEWVGTEKVDGTNIRVIWDGEKVYIRGKSDNASIPTFLMEPLMEMFPAGVFEMQEPHVLFGEGYGRKIQKGGEAYGDPGFILFDVWGARGWGSRDLVRAAGETLGIQVVPEVFRGTLFDAIEFVKGGMESQLRSTGAEGLVLRLPGDPVDAKGDRIITKIKVKDFR